MTDKIRRREFLKFVLTSGIVLTSAGGTVPLLSGCGKEKEVETKKIYNFLDHLDEAEVVAPEKAFVQKNAFPIAGEKRDVLFEHPDAQVTFKDVPIFRKARLSFGIGINEAAWDKMGDGVQFVVTLIDKHSGKHSLYSRYLEPKNNPEDRKWFDEAIDLKDFEGQSVSITFATSTGPTKDNSFGWAGWSAPQLQWWLKRKIKNGRHTNVILITLDTTRADHVSCYGYHRKTTPNLDKLARRSFKFLNAISPSPWTLPAHASLFTSLYPSQHGAVTKMDKDVLSGYPLGQLDFVLARLLKEQGLLTAGFVGGPFLKSEFGLNQGFDTYDDQWEGFDQRASQINEKVFRWLKENSLSPFFLFINYFDPHAPYNPPADFPSPFRGDYTGAIDFTTFGPHQIKLGDVSALKEEDTRRALDLYDTEILFMDYHLRKLLHKLEGLGLLDNSLIIITSDHGESFGENDIWGHGGLPIESQVRVPLIISHPPQTTTPAAIAEQVQTSSIYSTILKALDIPLPPFAGQMGLDTSLLGIGADKHGKRSGYAFAERFAPKVHLSMLRSEKWKYLVTKTLEGKGAVGREWVYDLKNDPEELKNLLGENKEIAELLRKKHAAFIQDIAGIKLESQSSQKTQPTQLNKEMRERLKALGYVQ